MSYKVNTIPVNSASTTTSRSSLPNLNNTRRRLLNRTPDNEIANTISPSPQPHVIPLVSIKPSQIPLLPHIPIHPPPPPPPPKPASSVLDPSSSRIQRASSPAALANTWKNAADCLKGVIACLDIHTEDGADVSASFEQDLKYMGAKTRKTFADTVTHLIYKNGSNQNVKKALHKKNCKIVNLLWITNCKTHGKHLPEDNYLIDHPENLILSATKRRPKCMEPVEVKALKLDKSSETSDGTKTGKKRSIANPTLHSTTKRPKLLTNSSSTTTTNTEQTTIPFPRKSSAIISKETTSSHYKNVTPTTPLVNMDLDDETMENNSRQQQSLDSEMKKANRSTMRIKSRHTFNTNNNNPSDPSSSASSVSQRPQINQQIKAGFYIKNPTSSSSVSTSGSTPASSTDSEVSSPLLRKISAAMTISPSSPSSPSKPLKGIRRRQRPAQTQTTTVAPTTTLNSLPPTSCASPSTSNNIDLLYPTKTTGPTIVLSSMTTKQKQTYTKIINKLGKYQLATIVDESTTHVIVGCQRRTQSVVLGLVHGVWIVTPEWLLDSDKSNNYLAENDYEALQFFPHAKSARQHDPLLPSTLSIYIHSTSMPKDLVDQLVIKGGGQVVTQLHDANIVISNIPCDCTVPTVMDDWLLDSIEQWRYLATKTYAPFSI